MPETPRTNRRWLRYSLATFLFACLCIGGSIAGYRSGYNAGYRSGKTTQYDETQIVETYSTTSVIWPDSSPADRAAGLDNLIDLIKTTIATDIWDDGSGNEVRVFPENQSLVICAPGWVQHEIRDLFNQLEKLSNRGGADFILPELQSMASQGKPRASVLDIKAPKDSRMAGEWLGKYFGITVAGISKHWGTPNYQGLCNDDGFPDWSFDQRIATWKRGSGLSYIALRIADDGQLHLVAGWRDKS